MPACDAACAVAVAVAKASGTTGTGKMGVPVVELLHPGSAGVMAHCAKADGDIKHNRLTSKACAARIWLHREVDRLHQGSAPDIPRSPEKLIKNEWPS